MQIYANVHIRTFETQGVAMLPSFHEEINLLHSRLCAGLADPKRILLLYALQNGEMNVSDLAQELHAAQPTISRHLKLLRERGLVNARRDGQSVFYSVADTRILEALDLMREVLDSLLKSQASLAEQLSA
jgi:ArsR family transcriptional regulator